MKKNYIQPSTTHMQFRSGFVCQVASAQGDFDYSGVADPGDDPL